MIQSIKLFKTKTSVKIIIWNLKVVHKNPSQILQLVNRKKHYLIEPECVLRSFYLFLKLRFFLIFNNFDFPQVPELNVVPQETLSRTLDNIAYIMPGL
jgi:hypothetical protein